MRNIKKLLNRIRYKSIKSTSYYCNICGCYVKKMTQNTGSMDTWASRTYNVIGAGFRDKNTCPICYSTDRHRFLNHYIENNTNIYKKNNKFKLLHFSPEPTIKWKILRDLRNKENYFPCNVKPGVEKYTVDITNISFEDDFFDYIICSYILEHIPNDLQAMQELFRVLKESGTAIVAFPITLIHDTIESTGKESLEERRELFCQEDHYRLYGMDVLNKFKSVGFNVSVFNLSIEEENYLANNRFIKGDLLFILTKNNES